MRGEMAVQLGAGVQPGAGVQRREGLVQQQQDRIDREGAGERDALRLPAGELPRPAPGVLGEADPGEPARGQPAGGTPVGAVAGAARRRRCPAR
nr:hypothetical protein GCM10020092_025830 [Actinoplanes digitatis]